jgi:hypothetical protein
MEIAQQRHQIFTPENFAFISVITVAELRSVAVQFKWGFDKKEKLNALIRKIPRLDINKEKELRLQTEEIRSLHGRHFQGC